MLQVNNATPFKASIMLLPDRNGVDTLYTVVKATFSIGAQWGLAAEQLPVTLTDQHHGEPAASSIRSPSDVCLGKPGTDVLLLGTAWAPHGRLTWQMDVSLSVGPVAKAVRVFGDRVWEAGRGSATIAPLAPFECMPLVWERAFGGSQQTDRGAVAEPRNPVGLGFRTGDGATPVAGTRLPNLEDPASLISSWRDAPQPACFAPVAPHWQPRVAFAGTYDEQWQRSRAPYLPSDFDPRFFQIAPPGLVSHGYLQGGESVEIRGATPGGSLRFHLPTVRVQVTYRLDAASHQRAAVLDTVIVEPDAGRLVMVWRSALACDKQALRVKAVDAALLPVA